MRFLRVIKPLCPENLGILGAQVKWLKRLNVFQSCIPQGLTHNSDYQRGSVVGMDAASCLAVEILDPQPHLSILEFCSAPGMKLIAIAELMKHQGTLVGVDISEPRLLQTCSLLRKYLFPTEEGQLEFSLWRSDATTWNPHTHKGKLMWNQSMQRVFCEAKAQKPLQRRIRGRALKQSIRALSNEAPFQPLPQYFDRILVDAECTTDGRQHGFHLTSSKTVLRDPVELSELQFRLLENGFRWLKPGGVLVYCTCSLMASQNEEVVERFVRQEHRAKVLDLSQEEGPFSNDSPGPSVIKIKISDGGEAWRLSPEVTHTAGFFIVKITKLVV